MYLLFGIFCSSVRIGVFIFITLLLLTDGRESDAAMSESDGKVLWGISSP
jgi:hypothetical protein